MTKENLNLWQRMMSNRKLLFIVLFLIILPVLFLTFLYIFRYNQFKDVCFDEDKKGEKLEFAKVEDLPITFHYEYTYKLLVEYEKDSKEVKNNGAYGFNVYYEKKGSINPSNVSVTFMIHANWMDYTYKQPLSSIPNYKPSGATGNMKVTTPVILPKMAFFPVWVSSPDLYIQIVVTINSQDRLFYLKDTKVLDQNPPNVTNPHI